MNWYYTDGEQQLGPFSEEEFQQLVNEGRVTPGTLVWREGMARWERYQQVRTGQVQLQTTPGPSEASCSRCGRSFLTDDMITYEGSWICAECKPVFFQRIQEGFSGQEALLAFRYAGFWIRFAAKFIDGIALWLVHRLLILVLESIATYGSSSGSGWAPLILLLLQYAIAIGYVTFFVGKFGATPGKMACRLKIIVPDGSRVSYWRAFGRYFAELLSGMILCIGYIMAAFDSQKRTLHDRICNTRVVRK